MNKKIVFDEIYGVNWILMSECSEEDAYKYYCKQVGDKPKPYNTTTDMFHGMFYHYPKSSLGGIWLNRDTFKTRTIVHECFHGTITLLQDKGIAPPREDNDEHYAYYLDWLFDKVFEWAFTIKNSKGKKAKKNCK